MVEFTTNAKDFAKEIVWTVDSNSFCAASGFVDNNSRTTQCCLASGEHTLNCKDMYGDGWNGSFVQIKGNTLCADFNKGSSKDVKFSVRK